MRGARLSHTLLVGACVVAAGCGSDDEPMPVWSFTHVKTVEFTDRVPHEVRETCARVAGKATVKCPQIVPRGGVVPDRDLYGFLAEPSDAWYDLTFNNGDNRGYTHWTVGGGARGEFARQHLDQSVWVKRGNVAELGSRDCAGRQIAGYRFPPYPAGGPLGGHSVALAVAGDREYYASVHGRYNLDASMALLLGVLGAEHPLRLCR